MNYAELDRKDIVKLIKRIDKAILFAENSRKKLKNLVDIMVILQSHS